MPNVTKTPMNPRGFVPYYGQGLRAKETQLGAIGTKEWLKSIKLHKYWPLVSHWSYWQMLSLTEDNIEYNIKLVRGTEITLGAKGKLLRSIEELRERKNKLKKIIDDINSDETSLDPDLLAYVLQVIFTPMPTSEEDSLPTLVVHSVKKVKEYFSTREISVQDRKKMEKMTWTISSNSILKRADENLRKLHILWEMEASAREDTVASRILPGVRLRRNRNVSGDSGFEENPNVWTPINDVSSIFPSGINSVMFPLPEKGGHRNSLFRSPFYPREESAEQDLEFEKDLVSMINNLLMK